MIRNRQKPAIFQQNLKLKKKNWQKIFLSIPILQASKKVKAQGIGVHKPEEIVEMGKEDLKALSELLADKPFFFGDEPTLVSTEL